MVSRFYTCVILGSALCLLNCRDANRTGHVVLDKDLGDRESRYPSANVASAVAAAEVARVTQSAAPGSLATTSATVPPLPSTRPSAQPAVTEALIDPQIAAITDGVNTAEIQQAQLARTKSKQDRVRSFASMMIEHHGEAKRKQAQLKLAQQPSALSRKLDEEAKTGLANLRKASSSDFDRAYLEAQAEGHQTVLNTLNQDLIPQAKDTRLQGYLAEMKPTVERHLEEARASLDALPASAASASASASAK